MPAIHEMNPDQRQVVPVKCSGNMSNAEQHLAGNAVRSCTVHHFPKIRGSGETKQTTSTRGDCLATLYLRGPMSALQGESEQQISTLQEESEQQISVLQTYSGGQIYALQARTAQLLAELNKERELRVL